MHYDLCQECYKKLESQEERNEYIDRGTGMLL